MGGAILVTLGVLCLLHEYHIFYFDQSWPLLLIVIGLLLFAARSAPIDGHVQPWWSRGRGVPPASERTDPGHTGPDPQVKL